MNIRNDYQRIEDMLMTLDLTVDLCSYGNPDENDIITLDKKILEDLINTIHNRISNRCNEFLIFSQTDRNISVDIFVKKLLELQNKHGNFDIGVHTIRPEDCVGRCANDETDINRAYMYGYTTEISDEILKDIIQDQLNVFKIKLRFDFYEYDKLLDCESIRNRFFEKYRAKKLNRILK